MNPNYTKRKLRIYRHAQSEQYKSTITVKKKYNKREITINRIEK